MATATRPGRFAGKRVRLAIDGSARPAEIAQALEQIYKLSGCTDCGRGGYDIILTHGDPVFEKFNAAKVTGVMLEEIAGPRG